MAPKLSRHQCDFRAVYLCFGFVLCLQKQGQLAVLESNDQKHSKTLCGNHYSGW
jgi:hypothetical protein